MTPPDTGRKSILITGATDGIGRLAALQLASAGHQLLLHGRSEDRLTDVVQEAREAGAISAEGHVVDLSVLKDVAQSAQALAAAGRPIDVLINNAGVYRSPVPRTAEGLDVRFAVNTFAPYLLAIRLVPGMSHGGRVVNISSAAQAPVDLEALAGHRELSDGGAYAQSKLALNMWTNALADRLGSQGPVMVSVNPGSMLATKMVREAFGVSGRDSRMGGDVLCQAALDESFAQASGQYFDNDSGRFADPHPDALNPGKCEQVVATMQSTLAELGIT